jgi:hypothetical protein
MNFAFRRPCWLTVITHSSIAILLIWLVKTNAFEFGTSINKVAMLGCCCDLVNLCACGCVLFRFESCKKLAVALGTHRFFVAK